MRVFAGESTLQDDRLAFALAPALTPDGVIAAPTFFSGFATHPQVLARGLVTLADITATRYFQYVPTTQRDPILTAQGDRMRAECFSACNVVYARLDLLQAGFDGGEIAHGTTNVDLGSGMRSALSAMGRHDLLHLMVGLDGLTVSTPAATTIKRPVEMPDRWVRALGNAAEIQHGLTTSFSVNASAAKAFIASLPPATAKATSGWLTPARGTLKMLPRHSTGAIYLSGLHRLSALKRVLLHVTGLTVFGPSEGTAGPVLIAVDLPGARLTLGLTDDAWRGYSGEGALLTSLASPTALEDADLLSVILAFDPQINVADLARNAALPQDRVHSALAVLATSGRVGWDATDQAWFHRELPDDPDRVLKDNPRLVAARALVASGAVEPVEGDPNRWTVRSAGVEYLVRVLPESIAANRPADGARCTCAWYLKYAGGRGACKHVLAVQLTHLKDES